MSASYTAFNGLMQQFLDALHQTFPEEQALAEFRQSFPMLSSLQPHEPLRLFMASVQPHAEKLVAHDESAILDGNFDLDGIIDVKRMWTADGVTDSIKDTIWSYLDTLYMLGQSLSAIPPEMLGKIETLAASIGQEVEAGGDMPSMLTLIQRVQEETGLQENAALH